jgi:hypothetical protein
MTYQEIKNRLAKCEFSLKCIADGSYKTKSKAKLTETTKKLIVLKESLQKQLVEAEGTVRTADSGEAEKLADKGVNVDLVEPKDLETNEQEGSSFDQNETAKIAASVGKATVLALQGEGENISSARVKRIKPNTFDVHVGFKNDNENVYAFYIVGDTLYLKDSSYDREISDVGVQQSGEAIINVDVVKDQLQKYFKTVNTALGEAERVKKVGEMTDQEFRDAEEKDRLDNHPEKEMIKKIQYLIAKEKANKKNEAFPYPPKQKPGKGIEGDWDYGGEDSSQGAGTMEENSEQDNAVIELRNIVDELEEKAEEARELVRQYFPNELSRLDGYGVFNVAYSANRYNVTLGKFVDNLEDGEYDDLDDDNYPNETTEGKHSINKLQKAHGQLVTKMKELAKQYKAGDKSVVSQLKDLTSKKKELEKHLDKAVAGKNKGQQLDPNVTEGRGDMGMIKGIIQDRANESGFSEREEAAEVIGGIADEYMISIESLKDYINEFDDKSIKAYGDAIKKAYGVKDKKDKNVGQPTVFDDESMDALRDIILKYVKDPSEAEKAVLQVDDNGLDSLSPELTANLERDPEFEAWYNKLHSIPDADTDYTKRRAAEKDYMQEGTELYDDDGLQFKRFAPGVGHDGPALQITARKLKGVGFDYIQIPGNKVKEFARAAVHVAQEFGDMKRQTTVNENVKKYRLGDMYSNNFDYIGMLKAGLKANVRSSVDKLKKLYSSFEDVNYHSENKHLYNAIEALEEGAIKEASMFFGDFHAAIKATLKDMK